MVPSWTSTSARAARSMPVAAPSAITVETSSDGVYLGASPRGFIHIVERS
jgi:hypothetical protein